MAKRAGVKKMDQQIKSLTLKQQLWICASVAVVGAAIAVYAMFWEKTHRVPDDRLVKVYFVHECSCVFEWVEELKKGGFIVSTFEPESLQPTRNYLHTPNRLHGCHVAEFMNYFVEGHVTPATLQRLVRERPSALGVASGDAMQESPENQDSSLPPILIDSDGKFHPWELSTIPSRSPREEMQL